MIVQRFDIHHLPQLEEPLSLALGDFDGVHLGHQDVLFSLLYEGSYQSAVLLLDPNEEAIATFPFLNKRHLMQMEDKVVFLKRMNLDLCLILEAGPELYTMESEAFIEKVLQKLGAKEIFVGEDYTFGNHGKGNPALLRAYFDVHISSLLQENGEKISSTRIKRLLEKGKVEEAISLLGHPYSIKGKVKEGFHRGSKLGFPTANLVYEESRDLLPNGVYYGYGYVLGLRYECIFNIGNNPTFNNSNKTIEAHLVGYHGVRLYDKTLEIEVLGKLREEIKFVSAEELEAQIGKDKVEAMRLLHEKLDTV